MPAGAEEGILKGIYKFRGSKKAKAQILGSGSILNEAVKAADLLKEKFGVETNVWSVTSYKNLLNDALDVDRANVRFPNIGKKTPWIFQCLEKEQGPVIAASDYMKVLPASLAKWIPGDLTVLGTDGFGRSDGRQSLREHFEVDAKSIAQAVLAALGMDDSSLEINRDKPNPVNE
jgi:pyruvate dehydrogenase E1 component